MIGVFRLVHNCTFPILIAKRMQFNMGVVNQYYLSHCLWVVFQEFVHIYHFSVSILLENGRSGKTTAIIFENLKLRNGNHSNIRILQYRGNASVLAI